MGEKVQEFVGIVCKRFVCEHFQAIRLNNYKANDTNYEYFHMRIYAC
jgi:hypothetical protein